MSALLNFRGGSPRPERESRGEIVGGRGEESQKRGAENELEPSGFSQALTMPDPHTARIERYKTFG
jgi:hypothetical protein